MFQMLDFNQLVSFLAHSKLKIGLKVAMKPDLMDASN